jgi:hypothetical protein
MKKLLVVTVTNNPEEYPEHAEASKKYPDLVEYVEDEIETFIYDPEDDGFWKSNFFMCVDLDCFYVDEGSL